MRASNIFQSPTPTSPSPHATKLIKTHRVTLLPAAASSNSYSSVSIPNNPITFDTSQAQTQSPHSIDIHVNLPITNGLPRHPMVTQSQHGIFKPRVLHASLTPSEMKNVKEALSRPF